MIDKELAIDKWRIDELAIQKYRASGQGIDFSDVMEFHCSKANAQRILKDCCQQRIGKNGTLHRITKAYKPPAFLSINT
jgi:hypothetical protein